MKKVLMVTGGGRGIGAAIAVAAERDGFAVAVNYAHDAQADAGVVAAYLGDAAGAPA